MFDDCPIRVPADQRHPITKFGEHRQHRTGLRPSRDVAGHHNPARPNHLRLSEHGGQRGCDAVDVGKHNYSGLHGLHRAAPDEVAGSRVLMGVVL
nr:hypothetical protein [Actinokineospora globicatena]